MQHGKGILKLNRLSFIAKLGNINFSPLDIYLTAFLFGIGPNFGVGLLHECGST